MTPATARKPAVNASNRMMPTIVETTATELTPGIVNGDLSNSRNTNNKNTHISKDVSKVGTAGQDKEWQRLV